MTQPPTSRDIQRWFPSKWSQIAGNSILIRTCQGMIRNGPGNMLVTGRSRTGKTRALSLLIRALACSDRTASHDPCGVCPACTAVGEGNQDVIGLSGAISNTMVSFLRINCATVTADRLTKLWNEVALESVKTIIYLDEVACLGQRKLEHLLLEMLDQSHCCFLASAVRVKRLSKRAGALSEPLLGRFGTMIGTSDPSDEELTTWIPDRCTEWTIDLAHPEETIKRILKKTDSRVGYIVNLLASAAVRDRRIGPDDVDRFNVSPMD